MTNLDVTDKDITVTVLTATALIFMFCTANFDDANATTTGTYQTLKKSIDAEYKTALFRCESILNDSKVLCLANAEAARDISKAELKASFKPSIQNYFEANLIRADATFTIAKQQCNGVKRTEQETCEKIAIESHEQEIASAKSQQEMEKYGEIQQDKTMQPGNLNQKSNLHMTYELSDIYHVRA